METKSNTVSRFNTEQPDFRFWEVMALCAIFASIVIVSIFACGTGKGFIVFGVLGAVVFASWLSGSAIGFLFGVPRFQTDRRPVISTGRDNAQERDIDPAYVPNTNLEQISDWLTKLIVGAALVQADKIVLGLTDLSNFLASQLGNHPGSAAIGGGMIVFNFVAGFLWGYLWCSLRIFREMAKLVEIPLSK